MQFEALYQELARGVDSVRTLVAGMTHAEARSRPSPDSWSALEVIRHLHDEEREDFRQRLDIMLHRPQEPLPPIDPEGWITARQYNQRDLAEMLGKFAAERAQSLAWLQGLSAPNWEAGYVNAFGSMKAGDMLAAWVAHDTLHLRQLVELRYSRLVSLAARMRLGMPGIGAPMLELIEGDAILTTARLCLEPITPQHAQHLSLVLSDLQLYTYIPEDPPADVASLAARYQRLAASPLTRRRRPLRSIGRCGASTKPTISAWCRRPSPQISRRTSPICCRIGILGPWHAQEACKRLLALLFDAYGMLRVRAKSIRATARPGRC